MLVARTMVLTVSLLAGACRRCPPPPPPLNDPPVCTDPNDTRLCPTGSCGANSPTINGFPINGLRPNGDCNADGVQLMPGSMLGGKCTGATLDVEDNALVGRDRAGATQCRGNELDGATFEVRSYVPVSDSNPAKRTLRIKIVTGEPHPHTGGETRMAYRLVRADGPGNETLCGAQASNEARTQLGLKPTLGLASVREASADVAIPVVSELYDIKGAPIEIKRAWQLHSRSWLHLACSGDALAERSLYHLHTDSLLRSRTALRMLTANYCGDKPFTVRGMRVAWGTGTAEQQLEARWAPTGATCVGKPRVLYKDDVEPQKVPESLPDELKKICNKAECPDLEAWLAAAHVCTRGDETRTLPPCEPQVSDPDPFPSFIVLPEKGVRR